MNRPCPAADLWLEADSRGAKATEFESSIMQRVVEAFWELDDAGVQSTMRDWDAVVTMLARDASDDTVSSR